jgi:glycosyltransferase involved in cell wall biosynthesis
VDGAAPRQPGDSGWSDRELSDWRGYAGPSRRHTMRILFLADGRSPIAQSWIGGRIEDGHEVHLVSSRAQDAARLPGLASFRCLPLISRPRGQRGQGASAAVTQRSAASLAASKFALHWLAPLWIAERAQRFAHMARELEPDLTHALRLPLEGMVAARAMERDARSWPLAISIWGNDFTLHAPASPFMTQWTRRAMQRADALHVDCKRDVSAAGSWGFERGRAVLVAPGNGGIRSEVFHPVRQPAGWAQRWGLPADATVFVNPRGLRGYARSDTFFKALPIVLRDLPTAGFLCVGMAGSPLAEGWVRRLNLADRVRLLPALSPGEMAAVFQGAVASLSITTHDGTPNTLLEAMACGCFPIAGDIASLREWIRDGENGHLVPPGDAAAVARAMVSAARSSDLRTHAAQINTRLVAERGEARAVGRMIDEFYGATVGRATAPANGAYSPRSEP